ncbi:unnamed protein product, partial [Polarella glacialis]
DRMAGLLRTAGMAAAGRDLEPLKVTSLRAECAPQGVVAQLVPYDVSMTDGRLDIWVSSLDPPLTLLIALLCVPAVAVALLWNSTCGLQCIYCGDMLCFVGAGLNILTLAAQLLGQELLASHETAVLNSQIMILLGLCTVPVAWHAVRESGRLRDYLWEGMAITGPPLKVGPRLIPRQVQQFHPAVPLDRVSLCRAALATAQGKKPEK